MAFENVALVRRAAGLSSGEKHLLAELADFSDAHGYCWPGVERLCAGTGMSRSTVIRIRARLEARNLLRHQRRTDRSGRSTTNMYRINLELLAAMAAPPREYGDNVMVLEFADEPAATAPPAPVPPPPRPPRRPDPVADQPTSPRETPAEQPMFHPGTPEGVAVGPQGCHGDTQTVSDPLKHQSGKQRRRGGARAGSACPPACRPGTPASPPPSAGVVFLRELRIQGRPPTAQVIRQQAHHVSDLLGSGWAPAELRAHLQQECAGRLANLMGRLNTALADTLPLSAADIGPGDAQRPWCERCESPHARMIVEFDGEDEVRRRCPDCHPHALALVSA